MSVPPRLISYPAQSGGEEFFLDLDEVVMIKVTEYGHEIHFYVNGGYDFHTYLMDPSETERVVDHWKKWKRYDSGRSARRAIHTTRELPGRIARRRPRRSGGSS